MKSLPFIIILSISIISAMTIAAISIENPIIKKYDETLSAIMIGNGLDSESETMKSFPELLTIKNQIFELKNWQADINLMRRSQSSQFHESQNKSVLNKITSISSYKNSINKRLDSIRKYSRVKTIS